MRKFLFVVLVLATIQNWEKLTGFFDPSSEAALSGSSQVIMYGTQWCGYCAKARDLFNSNGVLYHEYNIEKSSEGRKQFEALGGKGVPLIVINENVISGYNEHQILAALRSK